MKKISLLMLVTFLSFLSCTNENIEEEVAVQKLNVASQDNLDYYKGIPVAHRFDVSLEELGNTNLDVGNAKGVSVGIIDFSNYSLEQIAAAVEMELDNFPFIREEGLPEEQIELLKRDFPTLTETQIIEQMPIIEEYYYKNLDQLAYRRLEESQLPLLSKSTDYYYNFICIMKAFKDYGGTFGSFSLSAYAFYKAAIAKDIAASVFPGPSDSTKQDAYRHILWSSLLCRYYYTISSKAPKLRFAKAIGDINEECSVNNPDVREMDYHNNAIGRKVYDRNTPYQTILGFNVGLTTPSVGKLKNKTKAEVDKAFLIEGNSIAIRAQKIKNKKFNCMTKYIRKSRFICDNSNHESVVIAGPDSEDDINNNEDCWEYYYEPYQSCTGNIAVFLK